MAKILNPAVLAALKKRKKNDHKRINLLQTGLRVSNKLLSSIGPKNNL